jgi:GrpB-like predicted nucleotidyltransferase (UPF0157 family)
MTGQTDDEREAYAARLRAVHVNGLQPLAAPIAIVEYDPAWPEEYAREAARIRAALGTRALRLEHVGSTAVPGLAAKPRLDLLLEVADPADEAAYLPALDAAGYHLHIREPDWYAHRLCRRDDRELNLHIFPQGCAESARMLLFRDWLRAHPADRDRYERTKRDLAAREWTYLQEYADAKTAVVRAIMARAGESLRSR